MKLCSATQRSNNNNLWITKLNRTHKQFFMIYLILFSHNIYRARILLLVTNVLKPNWTRFVLVGPETVSRIVGCSWDSLVHTILCILFLYSPSLLETSFSIVAIIVSCLQCHFYFLYFLFFNIMMYHAIMMLTSWLKHFDPVIEPN